MKIEEIIKSNIVLSEAKKVMLNIVYSQTLISDKLNEVLKPYGLSAEQFNVLRILRGQGDIAVNMNLIQERMITKNSNTTRLIDKLLFKELVTRKVCPNNRRKMEVTITSKGKDLLEEVHDKVVAHENYFASNLDENELVVLNNLLEKYRILK